MTVRGDFEKYKAIVNFALDNPEFEEYCKLMMREVMAGYEVSPIEIYKGMLQGKTSAVWAHKKRTGKDVVSSSATVEKFFKDHDLKFINLTEI